MCAAFLHRPQRGARGRADGRARPARRPADQGRLPRDEPQGRGDPDEHAHARGGAGHVRPHQHHPGRPHHRARHRGRSCARWPAARTPQLTPVFLKLTGGRRLQEIESAVTAAFPFLLQPVVLGRAQPRATARARRRAARGALRRNRAAGRRGALRDRLLAHLAAARLRGARRLPDPPRSRLAVPDVPVVRRLQRDRERALDLLLVRGSAPAAGRARPRRLGSSTRSSRAPSSRPAGWSWHSCCRCCSALGARPLRADGLLRDGGPERRPVRGDPVGDRHAPDARPRRASFPPGGRAKC